MTPRRVQLLRTKGWGMPPNTVVVARGRNIGWGNPFVIGQDGIPDAATAIAHFRVYMEECLAMHDCMRAALKELRGKNLACWCKPGEPCHADVLLELANQPPAANVTKLANDGGNPRERSAAK